MSHMPWPSIESFAHVRKAVEAYGENVGPTSIAHRETIQYRAKIKLHGTNAGILIKNNGKDVFAQSRTSIITTGDDNAGFAAWVESTRSYWENLGEMMNYDPIVVFGEWCGKGVQKGVAISQIDEKIFAIFAIQLGDSLICVEPEMISLALSIPSLKLPKNVHVLPWFDFAASDGDNKNVINIDYLDKEIMVSEIERVESLVTQIDGSDPWVKEVFKVDGHGEGLVWYPVSLADKDSNVDRNSLSGYMFKTKGEKHKVVKTRELVPIDPEVVANVDAFVEMFVTEARLEQGAREVARGELVFEHRLIGPFIGWFGKDVNKESEAELEASGLVWKQVAKAVTNKARSWYLKKIEEI